MSGRLLDAGYELTVFDISDAAVSAAVERGARRAASVREVSDASDIVFTSLPSPAILEQIALGDDGIAAGAASVLVDVSTTGPAAATRIAEGLGKVGKQWVDCPVSGGVKGARLGTLALMVSCPADMFESIRPTLENFGKIFFIGEKPGLAQVVKLGNNMMAAAAIVVTSEALAMGVKAGVDPAVMIDVVNASSGRNSASEDKFPRSVLPGTFDFGFATSLSYKDVRMCIDEAEAIGVPMVAGALVRQMLAITNRKFGPDSDFTSMVRVVEDWAGVEIRSTSKS